MQLIRLGQVISESDNLAFSSFSESVQVSKLLCAGFVFELCDCLVSLGQPLGASTPWAMSVVVVTVSC